MAKGMESDVSDDDSESPSIDKLLDLVHEHQKVIKKQSKEIKKLNTLNDLNASLATNTFKHLLFTDDYINHLLTQELKENQAEIETYNIFHCLMKLVKGI